MLMNISVLICIMHVNKIFLLKKKARVRILLILVQALFIVEQKLVEERMMKSDS